MTKFRPTVDQLFASLKRCIAAKDPTGAQRAADEIIERAFEALDGDHDAEAVEIAHGLQKVDHPAGWEVEALVLDRNDESAKAIELLEAGVKKVDDSWRLWEMLGNLYSDADRFDDALKVYEKSLTCPEPDMPSVRFNMGLTHARAERFEEALKALEPVDLEDIEDEELLLNTLAFKASVLNSLGKFTEAADLARATISDVADDEYSEDTIPHLAEIHAQLARSVLEGERDPVKALAHAQNAIHIDQGNDLALQLIRAVHGKLSPNAQLMQLTVKGKWPEPFEGEKECREFRQTFGVIADNQEQAMEFVRGLTPEELRSSLVMEESETVQPAPEEPIGIVQVSPFIFFTEEGN